MPGFGGNPPGVNITCYYASDNEQEAMAAIEPLLKLDKDVKHDISLKDYVDTLEEAHPPQGMKIIVKSVLVEDFSDELVKTVAEIVGTNPTGVMFFRSLSGAMNRVAADATAFAHRSAEVLVVGAVFLPMDVTVGAENEALKPWQKVAAFGMGAYSNFLSTNTETDLTDIYPEATYERLAKIKQKYDPENIFRLNFNIKPSN